MNLLQLQYFYKIAHSSTLTQAAEELHVSQPSLSKLIRGLEDEFEIRLFERNGRYLKLNEKGEIFLRYATDILTSVDALREELQDCRMRKDLSLRVGIFAASALFPAIFAGFRIQYPNIKITMVQHSYEQTMQENSLDLIFFASRNPQASRNCTKLTDEEILLAVPQGHPLAGQGSVALGTLGNEKFICMSKGKTLRTIFDECCDEAGIKPNVVLETDDPAMLRNLIQSGFGISFAPQKTWMAFMSGDICLLHIKEPRCMRSLYLTVPKGTYHSTAARLFQRFMVDFFAQYDVSAVREPMSST